MTTIHIQQKMNAEEVSASAQVSEPILAFANKLEGELKAMALEHPNFRYAIVFGDENTEALGCMGNMSDSLAEYAVGLYVRAKQNQDGDEGDDDGGA